MIPPTPPRPLTVLLGIAASALGIVGWWQGSTATQAVAALALAGAVVLVLREP